MKLITIVFYLVRTDVNHSTVNHNNLIILTCKTDENISYTIYVKNALILLL